MPVNTVYIYNMYMAFASKSMSKQYIYIHTHTPCVQYYGLHTHVIPYGDDLKSNVLVSL